MKLQKLFFIPDVHVPYHDKGAWELCLKAIKEFEPDVVVTLGDFADFYAVSAHDKDPRRSNDLAWEVEQVHQAIDELERAADKAERLIYLCGNHEERLERYLKTKAPELFNTFSIPEVLSLDDFWEFVPYKEHIKVGKLYLTHDTGSAGATAHEKARADFDSNTVIGHTHRMAFGVRGSLRGAAHVGAMFGWLGDVRKTDYMHRVKASRDWCHGFGVGYLEPSGVVHLVPVVIVDGSCVVEGKFLSIKKRKKSLRKK
jgi:predicted phosphodiesterase